MDEYASYISKLRFKSADRYNSDRDLELKLVELSLSPNIDFDYFDYHVDWIYEIGNRLGFIRNV